MAEDEIELTRTHRAPDTPGLPEAGPRSWGEFRLLEELGHGGFGRVYHAWDATLARDIALKIVTLPDAARAAAALQEGRLLARVHHRNIVTVFGAQQIGTEVGVWMELVRGKHLSQLVREQGRLGAEEATVIGISVCQAVAAVHAAGLLHRDIKANNVMREAGGRIVLMDFGTGRESGPTTGGDMAGTPVYMAPEVLSGSPASAASDLYSIGVLLFYAVTGEYPVSGRSMLELSLAHRRGQRQLLSDCRPDLPDGFVRAVERALSSSPIDRPASAGAMLRELANALPGSASWDGRTPLAIHEEGTPGGPLDTPRTTATNALTAAPGTPYAAYALFAGVAAVAAIGVLGLLTSVAFNLSLGRDAAFSTDRAVDWWLYGARSLVAPAIYASVLILAGRMLVTAWHVLLRAIPPIARLARRATERTMTALGRVGAANAVAASQWLVFVQMTALVVFSLRFRGVFEAVTEPADASAQTIALLGTDNLEPLFYRFTATVFLLGMSTGWYLLLSRPERRARVHRTTIAAGAAVMVLMLLILVVPYRLLYHNEMLRVTVAGERCYEVGVHDSRVLLYCPDLPPPRVRVDDRANAQSSGIRENIFSPAPPPR